MPKSDNAPKGALPSDSRKIIKRLLNEGWSEVESKSGSSHRNFKHADSEYILTIPHPKKDFPKGTLRKIYRLAGWK